MMAYITPGLSQGQLNPDQNWALAQHSFFTRAVVIINIKNNGVINTEKFFKLKNAVYIYLLIRLSIL